MRFRDFLNESNRKTEESNKIVFHNYKELKEYCDDPNNPLDVVILDKGITSLPYLFGDSKRTNEQFKGIEDWDVSNVKNMNGMFWNAENFNQPLNSWNVSNVEFMNFMFCEAKNFNQPLDKWDVSNVEYMRDMFNGSKLEEMDNLPYWYH